jgi:hypothetical protein
VSEPQDRIEDPHERSIDAFGEQHGLDRLELLKVGSALRAHVDQWVEWDLDASPVASFGMLTPSITATKSSRTGKNRGRLRWRQRTDPDRQIS